ncbi:MAG: hypothetical protein HYV24_11635 [Deltaproteobacteria bacterium]|nr:hypothetical protein [Deltaproteobacteria bacterium]
MKIENRYDLPRPLLVKEGSYIDLLHESPRSSFVRALYKTLDPRFRGDDGIVLFVIPEVLIGNPVPGN